MMLPDTEHVIKSLKHHIDNENVKPVRKILEWNESDLYLVKEYMNAYTEIGIGLSIKGSSHRTAVRYPVYSDSPILKLLIDFINKKKEGE